MRPPSTATDAPKPRCTCGAFDDTAHRASFALISAGHDPHEEMPAGVLAGIDRVLAAARDQQRRAT